MGYILFKEKYIFIIDNRYIIIIPLAVLFALVIVPHVFALFLQVRASYYLREALEWEGSDGYYDLKCGNELTSKDHPSQIYARQSLLLLDQAIKIQPNLAQNYLLSGRAYCILNNQNLAYKNFLSYTQLRPNNPLGYLYLAIAIDQKCSAHINDMSNDHILDCYNDGILSDDVNPWRKAGIQPSELLNFGVEKESSDLYADSIRWYLRAFVLDPNFNLAKLRMGKLCQIHQDISDCDQFWKINRDNMIVDPEFTHQNWSEFWGGYEYREGYSYQVVNCPGRESLLCAHIKISETAGAGSAGFFQKISIDGVNTYHFSAWIKVNFEDNLSTWRPLAFVGRINEEDRAFSLKLPDNYNPNEWTFLEFSFLAPEFDNKIGYFFPVLLESSGEAWFYKPSLVIESGNGTNR
jgi:hypothetical protein